jgi:hypothetical protein
MPPRQAPVPAEAIPTPLSQSELDQMNALLARASAVQSPSTRPGDPYIALVNLNVPRRGLDPQRGSDLVMAGETVNLTPDEAAAFERHGAKDGRRIAVIMPASGPKSSAEQAARRVPPRAVSGALHAPPPPPPGSDMPLPDPAGASAILQQEVPETAEPVPGSENWMGEPQSAADLYVSAEDVIPARTAARQAAARG